MHNMQVITDNTVSNIIYIDDANAEIFRANGMELLNLDYLQIDDYRIDEIWYRDIDDVPTTLPLLEPSEESI